MSALEIAALIVAAWFSILFAFVAYALWVWHPEAESEGFAPCLVYDLDSYREHRRGTAA